MKLGLIGLGKMGSRIGEKLLRDEHNVIVWNRTKSITDQFQVFMGEQKLGTHLSTAMSASYLVGLLPSPKIIWLMLPAGEVTESVLNEIVTFVHPGDIIVDGGNAHFKDTERRSKMLAAKGIKFLGIGVSGGIHALENGYPLMVGGDASAYEEIRPILDSLSKPNGGHGYFGNGGAGHFVKMIHNGIEYGMMQAIGEGFGVLEKSPYTIDLLKAADIWQKNTIISGFLMNRAKDALEKDSSLSAIIGEIGASGEGEWTVEQAKEEGVPIVNIEQSLNFRKHSKTNKDIYESFAAKMVAALRQEFGGHEVKKR